MPDAIASQKKPRLVIYGVGQYGQLIARLALQKGWPVVAAYNRAGAKVGQDLGRLAGLGRDLGVTVQDCDQARYDAIEADIGIVAATNRLAINLPAYKRLMNAGLDVLCHGAESYYPFGSDPATAAEIDAIARQNGVTFTGSGIWDMSRIWSGLLLVGPCTAIRSLHHSSITNTEGQARTKAQALQVGTGMTVEEFQASGLPKAPPLLSYRTINEHVLSALGYSVAGSDVRIEPVVWDAPVESALMETVIPAGRCVGTRIVADTKTREGVTAKLEMELRLFRPGEVEHMSWSVDGMPRTRIRVERSDSAHATAASLFNRIPDVLAARPGVVLISELGPPRPSALL